jgi:hypothetical protein
MAANPSPRITTRAQLDGALARRKTMSHLRLGDALVQENLITTAQRDAALAVQAADGRKLLGEILVAEGAITRERLRQVLAEQLGVPSVNLAHFACDRDAIDAVAPDLARKHMVMPLYRSAARIAVGIENPLSFEALQELERSTQLKIDPAMANREDLVAAIARAYGGAAAAGHAPCVANEDLVPLPEAQTDLLALATRMVRRACREGSLCVHMEAIPAGLPGAFRFRLEGTIAT